MTSLLFPVGLLFRSVIVELSMSSLCRLAIVAGILLFLSQLSIKQAQHRRPTRVGHREWVGSYSGARSPLITASLRARQPVILLSLSVPRHLRYETVLDPVSGIFHAIHTGSLPGLHSCGKDHSFCFQCGFQNGMCWALRLKKDIPDLNLSRATCEL